MEARACTLALNQTLFYETSLSLSRGIECCRFVRIAQCSPDDFDFMGTPFGISPDPQVGETFADGTLGQPYSETIHVVIPASLADVPDRP